MTRLKYICTFYSFFAEDQPHLLTGLPFTYAGTLLMKKSPL